MILDVKDFYLNSQLKNYEHIFINLQLTPKDFINLCNLNQLAFNDKALAELHSGMCGLKQAGKLAYEDLKSHLKLY